MDQKRDAASASTNAPSGDGPGFVPYIPLPSTVLRPQEGRSAKDKMADMLQRVKRKEVDGAKMFRLRGKQRPPGVGALAADTIETVSTRATSRNICWITRSRIETAEG